MRVLITGSRNWNDMYTVHHAFDWVQQQITDGTPYTIPSRHEAGQVTIVSGHCPSGADFFCERAAFDYGFKVEQHPADWKKFGRGAGFIRNLEMVETGVDVCFAFAMNCHKQGCVGLPYPHMSHGTEHCATGAINAGIPTRIYWWQSLRADMPMVTERNWK